MKRFVLLLLAGTVGLSACADLTPTGLDPAIGARTFDPNKLPIMHVDESGMPYVPGQVVVRFRPGASRADVIAANRVERSRDMRVERMSLLEVPVGDEHAVAAALARDPNVEFATLNYAPTIVPCETGDCDSTDQWFFGRKWDLHNDGRIINNLGTPTVAAITGQVDADMDWLEAYTYLGRNFAGSAVIAILDSGIRDTHGDLVGKVIAARNFATGYPADFVEDRDSHGTHVAGIAAASGVLAMSGVAWGQNIKLINAKVCERYNFGTLPDGTPDIRTSCPSASTAEAIVWATDMGANVLNLSLGGAWNATAGFAPQQVALQYARANNVLPFCATANNATNVGYTGGISFPARFPECVAVASTDWFDGRASYSNWGPEVELSAPGGQVFAGGGNPFGAIFSLSNSANNTYTYKQGTSMATPQAAGLAALLFASGMTDAEEVLQRMKETAEDLGPAGRDPFFGYGRINVYRALTQLDPAIEVNISTRSSVNHRANGVLQVVLLNQEAVTYSLDDLEIESIRLGSTPLARRPNGTRMATWSDVNGDGLLDLVMHFSVPQLRTAGDLVPATTALMLHASIPDGRKVRGVAHINVH